MKTNVLTLLAGLTICFATTTEANAQSVTRTINGRKYTLLRGAFTQREAWRQAELRNGYAVVFETMLEHSRVVEAFGLGRSENDVCWTGHYQSPFGAEPGGSWWNVRVSVAVPAWILFNGNGPDDGITRSSPNGKNEDGGVIWKDNNGLLEDVSENYRANVLIEHR